MMRLSPEQREIIWQTLEPAYKVWLIARLNPKNGFAVCYNLLNKEYVWDSKSESCLDWQSDLRATLEYVKRFCKNQDVNAGTQKLWTLAFDIKRARTFYSEFAYHLTMALEYALRTRHMPGWYPGTAWDIFQGVRKDPRINWVSVNDLKLPKFPQG